MKCADGRFLLIVFPESFYCNKGNENQKCEGRKQFCYFCNIKCYVAITDKRGNKFYEEKENTAKTCKNSDSLSVLAKGMGSNGICGEKN